MSAKTQFCTRNNGLYITHVTKLDVKALIQLKSEKKHVP